MDQQIIYRKALGSLTGVVLGDALGMPTEFMSRETIKDRYGNVRDLVEPAEGHIHNDLVKGQITDDTEQTLYLARAIIKHRVVTPEVAAEAVLNWARENKVNQKTYLGPTTRKALERLEHGDDPSAAGSNGITIGAAMRIAPVGIINAGQIDRAIRDAVAASLPTHGSSVAIGAAAAVAASIAWAMTATPAAEDEIFSVALRGAREGEKQGIKYLGALVEKRIELALKIADESSSFAEGAINLAEGIGVDMLASELLPTALGLMRIARGKPMEAIWAAVNLGGDTDTLASIIGAIAGALYGPDMFPEALVQKIKEKNNLDLEEIARGLSELALERLESNRWFL